MHLDYVKLLINDYCVLMPDFDSRLAYIQFWLEVDGSKLAEVDVYNQTDCYVYEVDVNFWDVDATFPNEFALEIGSSAGYNIPTDVLL